MKFKQLDKGILKIWLIIGSLIFSLFLIGAIVLLIVFKDEINLFIPIAISDLIIILIIGLFCFVYPILKHKYYSYAYDEKHILIRRGIIFKHNIIIPVCQIQDLHIEEGPLQLLFKVSVVEISTAGSNYHITGIKKDNAHKMIEELDKFLLKRIEELNNDTLQ